MATYLSIWTGSEISPGARARVERVSEIMTMNDTHIKLIEPESYDTVVQEIRNSKWKAGWEALSRRVQPTDPPFPYNRYYAESDFIRLYMGTKIGDLVYLDVDVDLHAPLELNGDLPYFAALYGPRVDYALFAVNGATDYFERLLGAWVAEPDEPLTRRTLWRMLNMRVAGDFAVIPHEYFAHKGKKKWNTATT